MENNKSVTDTCKVTSTNKSLKQHSGLPMQQANKNAGKGGRAGVYKYPFAPGLFSRAGAWKRPDGIATLEKA